MTVRLIRVRGLVQGVGFRPYVWRLAKELGLQGWVRNDSAGVTIAVDGEKIAEFLARLPRELPRLARVDAIDLEDGETGDGLELSYESCVVGANSRGLLFDYNVTQGCSDVLYSAYCCLGCSNGLACEGAAVSVNP